MREIVKKRSPILNPPGANSRQCPLPSGASSIDLENSESFVQLDHEDLRFGVRRSCLSAPWARAELVHVLHPLWRAESSATRFGQWGNFTMQL